MQRSCSRTATHATAFLAEYHHRVEQGVCVWGIPLILLQVMGPEVVLVVLTHFVGYSVNRPRGTRFLFTQTLHQLCPTRSTRSYIPDVIVKTCSWRLACTYQLLLPHPQPWL